MQIRPSRAPTNSTGPKPGNDRVGRILHGRGNVQLRGRGRRDCPTSIIQVPPMKAPR